MLVKLTEVTKIGSTGTDYAGRTTFINDKLETREIIVNTDHVISINEDIEMTRLFKNNVSRLDTIRGSFTIVGNLYEIQSVLTDTRTKKVLRD